MHCVVLTKTTDPFLSVSGGIIPSGIDSTPDGTAWHGKVVVLLLREDELILRALRLLISNTAAANLSGVRKVGHANRINPLRMLLRNADTIIERGYLLGEGTGYRIMLLYYNSKSVNLMIKDGSLNERTNSYYIIITISL